MIYSTLFWLAMLGPLALSVKTEEMKGPVPEPEHRPAVAPKTHQALNRTNDDLFEYHNPMTTDDGLPLHESDMLLTDNQRLNRQAVTNLWSLPVYFAVNHGNRGAILAGVNHWRENTCVTFQEVSVGSSRAHLNFYQGGGCWSYVGQVNSAGAQSVSIGSGCTQLGTVAHEIGHAMGLFHQQSRTDRDSHVVINYANIQSGTAGNFEIAAGSLTHGVPYDLTSVMHYGSYYFSANGRKTIQTRNPQYEGLIGNRQELSHRDKHIANIMYGCANGCSDPPRCQNGGYVDKNCRCVCPPHASGTLCQTTSGSYYYPGSGPGPVTGSDCGDEDMRSEGTITSPNYPENFPKNVDCVWKITAPAGKQVKVTVSDMKMLYRYEDGVCYWDYMNFRYTGGDTDDFQACDDELKGRSFTSTEQSFWITFHSGDYGWYKGFSAVVEFITEDGGEC